MMQNPTGVASSQIGATLETITLEPGYYRTSTSSLEILTYYRREACLGGNNASQSCVRGYRGACKKTPLGALPDYFEIFKLRFLNLHLLATLMSTMATGFGTSTCCTRAHNNRRKKLPKNCVDSSISAKGWNPETQNVRVFSVPRDGKRACLTAMPLFWTRSDCASCEEDFASGYQYSCSSCVGQAKQSAIGESREIDKSRRTGGVFASISKIFSDIL